jgi:hypothetical protein
MNTIPQDQLRQKQIDRLAAQRQTYSDAKTIQAVQIVLAVPIVILSAILVAIWPGFEVYAACWGIGVALLDILVLNRWQGLLKVRAAKIQELFDCDVLKLEWPDLKAGRKPDAETIMRSSSRYRDRNAGDLALRDWYPKEVGRLPIHLARIICQRLNCWWDVQLRHRYAAGVLVVGGLLFACVLLVGLVGGLTLEKFVLAVLTPLLPAAVLGVRQFDENLERAKVADRLKEYSEDLWAEAISGRSTPEVLTTESRRLQDAIYDNRRTSPLIFDWMYRYLQTGHQEQANKGAETLIEEAEKALG